MTSVYRSGKYWVVKVSVLGKYRVFKGRTREEAVAKAHRFLEGGQPLPPAASDSPKELTLEQWVQRYLALGTWRPSTRATYQRCLEAWLDAGCATTPLSALTPLALREIIASWTDSVSPAVLSQRYRALRTCLEEAWRMGLIDENPLKRVPAPRVPRHMRVIWSSEQASRYLDTCHAATSGQLKVPYAAHADLLAFLLLTGLRISEALALTRESVLEEHIRIESALTWVGGKPHLSPPKSDSSSRLIPLPPLAKQILQQRLQQHQHHFVFCTRTGTPLRRDNMTKLHHALCVAAGVPHCRIHDLRRVHASLLLTAGAPVPLVQRLLGHSTSRLTLEVYSYVQSLTLQHPFG
ncbi:site-specific integrase, partial [Thermomicrobium sp.]